MLPEQVMAAGALQPFDFKDPKSWGPAYGSWINQQPATAQVLATTMLGGLQVRFRDKLLSGTSYQPWPGTCKSWSEAGG